MDLEIISCQRIIVAILQLHEFELVVIVVVREDILLKGSTRLSILCHCLCLPNKFFNHYIRGEILELPFEILYKFSHI